MSDISDSSPEERPPGNGENIFSELNRMREALIEKEKEINRLQREVHKLKSVIEKSELTRIPSYKEGSHQKKCGVSGECGIVPDSQSKDGASDSTKSAQSPPDRHNKDFRTRQLIRAALGDNDFLQNLDTDQVRDIADFMYPQKFNPGEYVIREGDQGCHLYVTAEGQLQVSQDSRNLGILKPGVAFGELALLYNCKRTASVRAITECKTWVLERRAFQMVMVKAGMQRIKDRMTFLRSVPLLKGLDTASLARIADCLEVEMYPPGAFIIREGMCGDTFFIISQGRVRVTVSELAVRGADIVEGEEPEPTEEPKQESVSTDKFAPNGAKMLALRELSHGDYFGEHALLREERRSANVIAITNVEVLTLDRESFMQLIGDLSEFNRLKKPPHFSSCSQLQLQASFSSNVTGMNQMVDDIESGTSSTEKLSKSLPNPSFEMFHYERKEEDFDHSHLKLDDLEFVATLGVGGFGRVELCKVSYDPTKVFALKCLPKVHIISTQQQDHVYAEKNIMLSCNSPFVARLYRTFKDAKYVYMLMEACLGGEVWTVLRDKSSFDDSISRFIAGCVLQALEYLHEREIVYRDLKPENLMFANDGYIKLVDFGFSKVVKAGQRTWTFCGTPEYCSPEIILNRGHDKLTDLWSLGILLFELLTGYPPYGPHSAENVLGNDSSSDPLATYNAILKGIDSVKFPKTCSKAAVSLIRRLCRQTPGERLGARNLRDIISHRWFQGFDWDGLRSRKLKPPIIPNLRGPLDMSNFDKFEIEIEDTPDDLSGWDEEF
ncbi:unnamed protein product [Orchesella dallaii]|uniref:cGMP-dependent protein kinase n=1 Tax=Orchesella dallaii TaxID=48710 RepID=A0ABP1QP94_9HEXA